MSYQDLSGAYFSAMTLLSVQTSPEPRTIDSSLACGNRRPDRASQHSTGRMRTKVSESHGASSLDLWTSVEPYAAGSPHGPCGHHEVQAASARRGRNSIMLGQDEPCFRITVREERSISLNQTRLENGGPAAPRTCEEMTPKKTPNTFASGSCRNSPLKPRYGTLFSQRSSRTSALGVWRLECRSGRFRCG